MPAQEVAGAPKPSTCKPTQPMAVATTAEDPAMASLAKALAEERSEHGVAKVLLTEPQTNIRQGTAEESETGKPSSDVLPTSELPIDACAVTQPTLKVSHGTTIVKETELNLKVVTVGMTPPTASVEASLDVPPDEALAKVTSTEFQKELQCVMPPESAHEMPKEVPREMLP